MSDFLELPEHLEPLSLLDLQEQGRAACSKNLAPPFVPPVVTPFVNPFVVHI